MKLNWKRAKSDLEQRSSRVEEEASHTTGG